MEVAKSIRERKVPTSIKVLRETVKPVAEKWEDGLIRSTDNLQLVLKNTGPKSLTEVWVYLYYMDVEGNELGHEFDITHDPVKPGEDARVSLMLLPPEGFDYAVLEVTADEHSENRYSKYIAVAAGITAVFLLIDKLGN